MKTLSNDSPAGNHNQQKSTVNGLPDCYITFEGQLVAPPDSRTQPEVPSKVKALAVIPPEHYPISSTSRSGSTDCSLAQSQMQCSLQPHPGRGHCDPIQWPHLTTKTSWQAHFTKESCQWGTPNQARALI